jgi:YegS/Rv2252/BmrU family lipid kinase
VRTCVIFNPAARGNKAKNFRRHLHAMAAGTAFKATASAGDARRLAAEAVQEGYEMIVAAGGDGTVNEVLNGLGDAPGGFESVRFGVLPLGTINVLARELGIQLKLEEAWQVLQRGNERRIDLPRAEFQDGDKTVHRYFVQLAGAGLDARAIELTDWKLKKATGPLAYVIAGLKALRERKPMITVEINGEKAAGQLILIGNGKMYGGSFHIFPAADLRDEKLHVCVLPRTDFGTLFRCAPTMLFRQRLPETLVRRFTGTRLELKSDRPAALELDGEWAGHLPAILTLEPGRLRMAAP